MELRLELHRSKDAFTLIHNDVGGAAITIHSAQLHLRRVKLSDSMGAQIDAALARERALYPVTRFRVFQESFKSQSIDFTNILSGAIPTHVVVAFVDSTAVHGTNKLNPFNLAHYGLTCLQVTAAGVNYPRTELALRFNGTGLAGAQVAREYSD